ncbi:MAG: glycosyltransferase family 4 protein [Planctomycetota bacterium]|jgi:glycosyltransferase involved in cell wall biosynthesis
MKVAMIGLRGLGDGLGGVEKVVREVSTRLVERGVEVTCYCRPRYNTDSMFEGVRLINTPTLYSKHAETACYALGALLHASRQDYDIIHIHAMASSVLAWMPRVLGNSRIVISVHGLDWQRAKWGMAARNILRLGEWCAVHLADCTVCVSLSLTTYFQMRYLHHPFAYIPNGCDLPPAEAVTAPEGVESRGYLLYMGRLVPEKGVHRLITAFRSLDTEKSLLIAGPESHAPAYGRELRRLAGDDPRIHFLGSVTGERKESLLSHAYAFVLPSELEGLPVALLEAASRGICPVVSAIPTSIEVLGDWDLTRGYTFSPDSTEELACALSACLENPELTHALGEQARERVMKHYNWETITDRTLAVYNDVLKAAGKEGG